jgi:hypothetical protein
MPGSWRPDELQNLTDGSYAVASPATNRYNCLAWAAGEDFRWWWPDPLNVSYWPPGVDRSVTAEAFVQAYSILGFSSCPSGDLELGVEKIALYGVGAPGAEVPTHAARQLPSGEWTSKLGPLEDITHASADGVAGRPYGRILGYLARRR